MCVGQCPVTHPAARPINHNKNNATVISLARRNDLQSCGMARLWGRLNSSMPWPSMHAAHSAPHACTLAAFLTQPLIPLQAFPPFSPIHPHTLTMACTIQTLSVSSLRAAAARAPRQQARRALALVRASSEETPAATEQHGGTYFFAGKSMSEAEVIELCSHWPATQRAHNHLARHCEPFCDGCKVSVWCPLDQSADDAGGASTLRLPRLLPLLSSFHHTKMHLLSPPPSCCPQWKAAVANGSITTPAAPTGGAAGASISGNAASLSLDQIMAFSGPAPGEHPSGCTPRRACRL